MKWYKHISDSLDDPFIFELMRRFRSDGYLVFFGTLEVMSREFDINTPGICRINAAFLRQKLHITGKKLAQILAFCTEKERIFAEYENDDIVLNCPKLKDLCDEWTQRQLKKLGSASGVTPPPSREVEEEERESKNAGASVGDSEEIETTGDRLVKKDLKRSVDPYSHFSPEYQLAREVLKGFSETTGRRTGMPPRALIDRILEGYSVKDLIHTVKVFKDDPFYADKGHVFTPEHLYRDSTKISMALNMKDNHFKGNKKFSAPGVLYTLPDGREVNAKENAAYWRDKTKQETTNEPESD